MQQKKVANVSTPQGRRDYFIPQVRSAEARPLLERSAREADKRHFDNTQPATR